ncbi:MAG: hypothetical protein AAGL18_12525 [Pseudomonadota bacterium]
MSISPGSQYLGYLSRRKDGNEVAIIFDRKEERMVAGVGTRDIKARSIAFAGENYAILQASDTTSLLGFRGKFEFSAAFSLDFKNRKI